MLLAPSNDGPATSTPGVRRMRDGQARRLVRTRTTASGGRRGRQVERGDWRTAAQWKYLYRAVDCARDAIDFLLRVHRDLAAARRLLGCAIDLRGVTEKITIDTSGENTVAMQSLRVGSGVDIEPRQSKYLNDIVDQDHRAIKRIVRPMLGFKPFRCARAVIVRIQTSPTGSAKSGAWAPTRRKTRGRRKASCATCGGATQAANLWFHGGNLHQSRHYSQFLSLQLKAHSLPFPYRD